MAMTRPAPTRSYWAIRGARRDVSQRYRKSEAQSGRLAGDHVAEALAELLDALAGGGAGLDAGAPVAGRAVLQGRCRGADGVSDSSAATGAVSDMADPAVVVLSRHGM
jgi:hypothetical protein